MPALATWTPEDGLLGALAPLGLALAAEQAIVLDLDPEGPRYPGGTSLKKLVAEGPTRSDLTPGKGVAVVRNGGIGPAEAAEVVAALVAVWPNVVFRLPGHSPPAISAVPVVPIRLLLPGDLFEAAERRSVFQATPSFSRLPAPGVRLPVPRRSTVSALVMGRRPVPRDPWIKAWRSVWRLRWDR